MENNYGRDRLIIVVYKKKNNAITTRNSNFAAKITQ